MKVGLIGTGAIAHKHAESYAEIGFELAAVTDIVVEKGKAFAEKYGPEFFADSTEMINRAGVDYIDVCTFPDSHLGIVRACAAAKKNVLLQKPMDLRLDNCREMIELCEKADVRLGVVSQHRFDKAAIFLKKAITDGRMGKLLQVDGYVKWHREQSYYDRPGKGTWAMEGGGALINQGIHTVDVSMYLAGMAKTIAANWQLGAAHEIEVEDILNAIITYEGGVTGVLQASTAFRPGYSERIEIHGTKGSAIITGDKLTHWDVDGDAGEDAPIEAAEMSGAADPMAIPIGNLKRQFQDFGCAVDTGGKPLVDGEQGYRALQIVLGVYEAAREAKIVTLA